jgi:hypothetical protein
MGHIFMVFAVDPYSLRSMTTGGYSERLSPEDRNARPFYHLLPQRAAAPPVVVAPAADVAAEETAGASAGKVEPS